MKITDIKMEKVRIQLTEPFRVAFATIDYSENLLIKVCTDEGLEGYGEAAPLPFVTGETIDSVVSVIQMLRPGLIGMNPLDIEKIHELMDGCIHGNGSAKCAVDLAMYDLMGKAMGLPVYKILGGYSNRVQNDITIGINTPEAMAEEARVHVEKDGFHILKVKAGIHVKEDIAALRLIRETVGPDIRLRVDANQGYDVSDAVYAMEEFRKIGVEAVEQCLPAWDFEGAAYVRSKVKGIRVMLDESIHDHRDAARACKNGCADTLNIKLMKCGGLFRASQINAIAEAFGVNCMVGCMMETKLATTAGVSLVASKKNITEADCDSFLFYEDEQTGMSGGFIRENDLFTLLDAPGFGLDLSF
ncbi:MAG: dipeptide epimerase [Candidatus Limivivens sp.]|nr:dipeptide epimerase [Candidatus Limivivens sp.]